MKTKGLVTLLSGTKEIIARGVRIDQQQCEVIIEARVPKRKSCRCPFCGKRGAQYDQGRGVRRWRCLDMGNAKVFIEATAPRIRCPKHGIVVAAVPWARHGSAFSQAFESTCCWLSIHSSKKVVSEYLRIDWHTVGAICTRVYQELEASRGTSRFDNLERIGIDETSYKKGHKYLTVVVNHETNSVVWVGKGYGKEVLSSFFKLLDDKQRGSIKLVSADGARWIASCVEAYCPNATRCIDPFHVVSWATGLLDDIRKELWREVHKKAKEAPKRPKGRPKSKDVVNPEKREAQKIKGCRYALLKNPEDLTTCQQDQLEFIVENNPRLYRAYLLKESLRLALKAGADEIESRLKKWMAWAQRCRIPHFVELRRKIKRQYDAIVAAATHNLSNARGEAINNKIKVRIRMAYGFRNIDNLIAMIMLGCSDIKPKLRAV